MTRFTKRGLNHACIVSRHIFHHHLLKMYLQHMYSILLKVEQSAFTQAFFSSLSDIHECLSGCQFQWWLYLPLASRQPAVTDSQHDRLMSFTMDLAAFCNKWRWKWHQWKSFGCFIEDVAFAHHLVTHHLPPPSYPIGVLVVLGTYTSKNNLKWWAILLPI